MSRRTGLVIKTVLLEQPNLHDTGLGVQRSRHYARFSAIDRGLGKR